MKRDVSLRRGLRESLEGYALRLNLKVEAVRASWRAQGLRLLGVSEPAVLAVRAVSHVRIAPGVAIECGPEPHDVIEIEPGDVPVENEKVRN